MALSIDSIPVMPYDSGLYAPEALIEPIGTFADITDSIREQYHELGFISVANAFSSKMVDAARVALVEMVNSEIPEGTQLQFESEAKDIFDTLSPDEKQDYVRKFMSFSHL